MASADRESLSNGVGPSAGDGQLATAPPTGQNVKLERSLGLFTGVSIIVGTIVGSGIFVSPKGVLIEAGSVGLSLIVWALCGAICLCGAHCLSELGVTFPSSGGIYDYIKEAFGGFAAFMYLWVSVIITWPAGNAIIALTFAFYILQPSFETCNSPDPAVKLLAAAAICLLTCINCISVKWAARVQDVFTVIKVLALLLIIATGIVVLCMGNLDNFEDSFANSSKNPGKIALAFYSGLFSYSGWYSLNFLIEELKNPYRNLPLAIWISMPLVTLVYVLANVAYFAVLTPVQIIESEAVAVTFAMKMFGVMAWIMPIFVAFSTFGSLNGCIMSVSRLFFVGAREGHLPDFLALISVNRLTPLPSLVFQAAISILLMFAGDVFALINYVTFVETLSLLLCVAGQLYLRWKRPNISRPIKVNLFYPIFFCLICLFLLAFGLYSSPFDCGMSILFLVSGIPVYLIGVSWRNKPRFFTKKTFAFTKWVQKLTVGMPQEGKIE